MSSWVFLARAVGSAPAPGVAVWVADRGAGRVVGLDAAWNPRRSVSAVHPRFLAALPGAADAESLWVVEALEGTPSGPHRLRRLGPGGEPIALAFGPVRALASSSRGELFVLEGAPPAPPSPPPSPPSGGEVRVPRGTRVSQVHRVDRDGHRRLFLRHPGAQAMAAAGGRLAVGDQEGGLAVFEAGERAVLLSRRSLHAAIGDLAAAPEGGWWALAGGRLFRLGPALQSVWERSSGVGAGGLGAGERGVWVVDTEAAFLQRFAADGARELLVGGLSPAGLGPLVPRPGGGLWIAGPGALLELDEAGTWIRAQGGFDFVSDLLAS